MQAIFLVCGAGGPQLKRNPLASRGKPLLAFTPDIQLQTLFVLNAQGRILSTREPNPSPGPKFALIRGTHSCAWAAHADLPNQIAAQLDTLAREEPPTTQFGGDPLHAKRYLSLAGGRVEAGPAFTFPTDIPRPFGTGLVTQLAELQEHFHGWTADELPERSPICAVVEEGHPVSICFCARLSPIAAEAGVETAKPFRRRGFASQVTAAWALAIRSSHRLPIYSTSWDNAPSLAFARRLGLTISASDWSLYA